MKHITSILKITTMTSGLLLLSSLHAPADETSQVREPNDGSRIALYYSDGSNPSIGVEEINRRLIEIGVRVSQVSIPEAARPILQKSKQHKLSADDHSELIRHFHLGRRELLQEIKLAGRTPAMPRGGYLQTSEVNVAPYPKVYDMKALDESVVSYLQSKFGRLHVNSSEAGVGIDEVMTIVSGGPYTWFFVLNHNVVGKLRLGKVAEGGKAWRISYPGLVPHGGYFDAEDGVVVAYAHGPEHFVMRYEDPSVEGFETLNDNPWIDFTNDQPRLLDRPKLAPGSGSDNSHTSATDAID